MTDPNLQKPNTTSTVLGNSQPLPPSVAASGKINQPNNLPIKSHTNPNYRIIILGATSVLFSVLSPCGMLLGILGLVFALRAKDTATSKKQIYLALGLSATGLLLSAAFGILYTLSLSNPEVLN